MGNEKRIPESSLGLGMRGIVFKHIYYVDIKVSNKRNLYLLIPSEVIRKALRADATDFCTGWNIRYEDIPCEYMKYLVKYNPKAPPTLPLWFEGIAYNRKSE